MQKKYTDQYIVTTIQEATDIAALEIAKNFALDTLAENGVVTKQEVESMYTLATKVISEGSEDLIPETLDLPEAVEEPEIATPEVAVEEPAEDLDVSELEGIILPDAEGNQYVIQNGMIMPYADEATDMPTDADAVADAAEGDIVEDEPAVEEEEVQVEEATAPVEGEEATAPVEEATAPVAEEVEAITESTNFSDYTSNSDIVQKLIDNVNLS